MTSLDLTALAAQIMAVLVPAAPYLQKAAEGAASKIGGDAWTKAKELLGKLRERFAKDGDAKATQTLELFLEDTDTFEVALTKILAATLEKHPDWAEDVRGLLADEALQEIIARNSGVIERATQTLSGGGTQRMIADSGRISDARQEKS